ncbi:hypothetical protein Tco_0598844 [Tanacetum coccineum]
MSYVSRRVDEKKKHASDASTSCIFTIELYSFPNKSWVYDMGCGTHICNTTHGLQGSKKLKLGALNMYVGNGHRAAVDDYALESAARILNMVPTKKVEKTQCEEPKITSQNRSARLRLSGSMIKRCCGAKGGLDQRSTRTRHAPDRICLYVDVEEHELGDHNEPANYKVALSNLKCDKWLEAMNVEMQSMKDN